MNRSGMPLEKAENGEALSVASTIQSLSLSSDPSNSAENISNSRFRGLHFYDGHAAQWADREGSENSSERSVELNGLYYRLIKLTKSLEDQGIKVLVNTLYIHLSIYPPIPKPSLTLSLTSQRQHI